MFTSIYIYIYGRIYIPYMEGYMDIYIYTLYMYMLYIYIYILVCLALLAREETSVGRLSAAKFTAAE